MKKLARLLLTALLCLSIVLTAVTPAFAAVAKVKKLKATVTYNTVTLTWSKTSGVSGYEVQRASGKKWKTVGTTRKTTFRIKKLKTGTTYKFRVRAYKLSGKTKVYGSAATVSAKPVCAAPKNLKAAVLSPTTARLTWAKTAGASRYRIQKWNGKKWVYLTNTKGTSVSLNGLTPSVAAKFRVCALTQVGKKTVEGKYTSAVQVKTTIATPSSLLASGETASSVKLSWSKVAGATDYVVYQNGKLSYVTKTNSVTANKGLLPGTVYKFTVRARVNASGKYYLSPSSYAVSAKTAPAAVSGFSAEAKTADSVTLSWKADPSAEKYQIFMVKDGKNELIASPSKNVTEYTYYGLEECTEYSFRIRALGSYGSKTLYGALSPVQSATTPVSGVKGLSVESVAATSAVLSWKALDVAQSYTLEQSSDKKTWTKTADINTAADSNGRISYTVNGLKEGSVTYFRVASKITGYSETAYSTAVTVKTVPGKVTGLKATVSADSKSVTVTWAAIPSADGYIVKFDGTTKEVSKNSVTLTLSSVYTRPNTKYSCYVLAFTKFGSGKLTGAESDPCVFKTALGNISNLRTTDRTSLEDGKIVVYSSLLWDSIPNAEFIVESKNTAVDSSWHQLAKSSTNMVNVNGTIANVKAAKKSDYVTTLSWQAVPGASKYIIKSTASASDNHLSEIATTTSTSIDLNLAPSTKLNLVVLAVASSVSYRVKAVDTDKINPDSAYKTVTAANSVIASASVVYTTPALSAFDGSAESQRAYVLRLVQAINNTKDEQTPVTAQSHTKLAAKVDNIDVKVGLVWMKLDAALALLGMKDDLTKEFEDAINEDTTKTLNFDNGIAFYTENDKNGNSVRYSQRLNSFIVPTPERSYENRYAYLYNQNDLSAFSKGISKVTVTESGSKTTVSVTIKQEGTNAVYHPGFMDTITNSLGSIAGNGAECSATIGASTVTGVINSSGTLDSLKVSSPFKLNITMTLSEDGSLPVRMTLSGSSNYDYTFTR